MLLAFALLLPVGASSQTKKVISQAKQWVKAGNNLDKAESKMMELLKDSANRDNEKIWNTLFAAQRKQYEQGNEKLYLKQKYDTATLFNIASRMFTSMESYDSIDSRPNKKGEIEPKYRKANSDLLDKLRPNLFHGGLFFIRKQKWGDAYHLFDQYIDAAQQPLFASRKYSETDKRMPEAAYWAVYAGYKMKDVGKVLHHTYLALKDTAHYEMMLQYLAETYRLDKDTARFVKTLEEGFHEFPLSQYFFPNLIAYYSQANDWEKALERTDEGLKVDSTDTTFLLTKSTVLLNLGDYEQAYKLSSLLLSKNDSLPEANLNAGLALFNQGVTLDKSSRNNKNGRKVLKFYKEALPYLEKFRKMEPDRKDKWALPLYTIYLNLNMGKEFDEIDKLMKK
jgi:hypothetical protein